MKRALLSLMLLVGLVATPMAGAMAQPVETENTFVSELTGDEVNLGTSGEIFFLPENYDLRESVSFQEEYIWFTHGWSNFQLILIGGPVDPQMYHDVTLQNMEDFYSSWEVIDEGITDDHSWFIGQGATADGDLIVYYEFELDAFGDIDMAVMQFTDSTTFVEDLQFVQSEVTVGGAPILPNTDAQERSALIGSDTGTPDSSPETDDADSSDTDRTSRTSRGGTEAPEDDEGDDTGSTGTDRTSRTSRGGTEAPEDDESDDTGSSGTDRTSRTSRGGAEAPEDDESDDAGSSDTDRTSRTSRGGTEAPEGDDEGNTSETSRTSRGGAETTDPDDDEEASGSGGESRTGRLGNLDTNGSSESDDDATAVAGGDWSTMGLISDTEWESPSHGHVVSWDAATWEFPTDYESAIVINDEYGYDIITLQTVDGLGYVYLTVDFAYESTPASLIDYWTSDDYLAQLTNDATLLDWATTENTASIVYETTNTIDQPLLVVLEATFLGDGTVVFSQISAAPETIDEVYEQYIDGVTVNGSLLSFTWTPADIREIVGM